MAHVVGIGASAVDLDALQEMVGGLASDAGMAYVVAQHPAPDHQSLIVELVAHATDLRVVTAVDGAALEADVIAIAPPNHDITVEGERLRLSEPVPRFGPAPCIDLLFESLAQHWGERAAAVVLSGTGADGVQGVQAVRAAGGLTIARSPGTAGFDGMPRAALPPGGADLVLEARAIGARLAELMAPGGELTEPRQPAPAQSLSLTEVTNRLEHVSGTDVSLYGESTLRRQLRRSLAELEQANVELENIQASLSQGMVIVDPQLRITRFSPPAVGVFGLVESDIGEPLLGVPTTVPLPALPVALKAVIEGQPPRSFEAASEEVAYLVQVLPYLERDGRRRGAIVILTDVSELMALRHIAEATLSEFSALTDALDAVVWKWDHRLDRLLFTSQRVQSLTGWSPKELRECTGLFEDCIHPDDLARVEAARDVRQGQWSIRYRMATRDGHRIWVEEAACVVSGDGNSSVVGTLADVTADHAREEHASELSAIFESVFHSRRLAVAVLDEPLRVVMANEAFCALVGFDQESILGVAAAMFAPQGELEALTSGAMGRGGPWPMDTPWAMTGFELHVRNREGMLQPVQAELRPLRQRAGKARMTLIVQPPLESEGLT